MIRWLAALLCLPTVALADCVLLVHGLARTDASFWAMENGLGRMGFDTVAVRYPSTEAPIEELSKTLPEAFDSCPGEVVHVATHSMGGILVRLWLQDGQPERLGRVVMLAPPNQGAQLVDELDDYEVFHWINGPAGAQLGTEGLPTQLGPVTYPVGVIAGNRTWNPISSTLIDGSDDGKVAVRETYVAGATDHIVMPVTHTTMMVNPMVIAQTGIFLRDGAFDRELTLGKSLRLFEN